VSSVALGNAGNQGSDWAAFYGRLEIAGLVPAASEHTIDGAHAQFRGMVLDLAEIRSSLAGASPPPTFVTLYCDYLLIPAETKWLLDRSALTIIARRVQIGAGAMIEIAAGTLARTSLIFFADEVEGALQVVPAGQDAGRFTIDAAPPAGGIRVRVRDGMATSDQLTHRQGLAIAPTRTFQRALATEFMFVSLLYEQEPQLASAMCRFLVRWSQGTSELLDVFLRSSSMLAWLHANRTTGNGSPAFVPYLTCGMYAELLKKFVAEAQEYERSYRTIATERKLTGENITLAKRLAAQQLHQSEYVGAIVRQAADNYDSACAAVTVAKNNVQNAKRSVDAFRTNFVQNGIPEWQRQQIAGAVISLATALVTFAVDIGVMVATSGTTAGVAAEGAVGTANAIAKAAESGEEVASIAEKLAGVMKKLKETEEVLGKVFEVVGKLVEVSKNLDHATELPAELRKLSLSADGAGLTAPAEWDVYRLTATEALKQAVEEKIGFASELAIALQTVAIYGQALATARIAAVKAGQTYANALLQKELAARQQKNMERYVAELETDAAATAEVLQQLCQRYLDVKSSMLVALLGYRTAYAYWALQPSEVPVRLIDGIGAIDSNLNTLTVIAFDDESALQRFSPPPQPLVRKQIVIADPAVIESLRATHAATWNIPLDTAELKGLDRVRLTTIRLWLEGAHPDPKSQVMSMFFGTSGAYLDRFRGTQYHFVARPLRRNFQYRVAPQEDTQPDWKFHDKSFGYIEVDGAVDSEVSYAYFEPTPFTQWELRVEPQTGLSNVTRIRMEMSGSAIAAIEPGA
jgi:hypothetical protein